MEKRHRKQSSLLQSLLIGGGIALLIGAALVFCVAAILLRSSDPTSHLLPAGLGCLAVTALLIFAVLLCCRPARRYAGMERR